MLYVLLLFLCFSTLLSWVPESSLMSILSFVESLFPPSPSILPVGIHLVSETCPGPYISSWPSLSYFLVSLRASSVLLVFRKPEGVQWFIYLKDQKMIKKGASHTPFPLSGKSGWWVMTGAMRPESAALLQPDRNPATCEGDSGMCILTTL